MEASGVVAKHNERVKIAPSILNSDLARIADSLALLEEAIGKRVVAGHDLLVRVAQPLAARIKGSS